MPVITLAHGLEVDLARADRLRDNLLLGLEDVVELSARRAGELRGRIEVVFGSPTRDSSMRSLEHGVAISSAAVLDERYGLVLERPSRQHIRLTTDRSSPEWIIWSLQLLALANRATFVHGAALERNGEAILFPSWGGVGKTALVAEFVRRHGWRLLGDDLSIVDANGNCFGFPKAMVLYPYHKPLFPEVFSAGRGPAAPTAMNDWLTRAGIAVKPILRAVPGLLDFARKHNPQSVRVRPSEIFGATQLAQVGKIKAAVWLERRADISKPMLEPGAGTLPGRILGSTINEFDSWCVRLTNIALGNGIQHLEDYFSAWIGVLETTVGALPQLVLSVPAKTPVEDLPSMVNELIAREKLISE